jgi:hypothetical protein
MSIDPLLFERTHLELEIARTKGALDFHLRNGYYAWAREEAEKLARHCNRMNTMLNEIGENESEGGSHGATGDV